MGRVTKVLLVLYLGAAIYPFVLLVHPLLSALFLLELAYLTIRFWKGESLKELLMKSLHASLFLTLLVTGFVRIESYPLEGYEIKELYIESEGRYARCGTSVLYTRMGLGQIWFMSLWWVFSASRKAVSGSSPDDDTSAGSRETLAGENESALVLMRLNEPDVKPQGVQSRDRPFAFRWLESLFLIQFLARWLRR